VKLRATVGPYLCDGKKLLLQETLRNEQSKKAAFKKTTGQKTQFPPSLSPEKTRLEKARGFPRW